MLKSHHRAVPIFSLKSMLFQFIVCSRFIIFSSLMKLYGPSNINSFDDCVLPNLSSLRKTRAKQNKKPAKKGQPDYQSVGGSVLCHKGVYSMLKLCASAASAYSFIFLCRLRREVDSPTGSKYDVIPPVKSKKKRPGRMYDSVLAQKIKAI